MSKKLAVCIVFLLLPFVLPDGAASASPASATLVAPAAMAAATAAPAAVAPIPMAVAVAQPMLAMWSPTSWAEYVLWVLLVFAACFLVIALAFAWAAWGFGWAKWKAEPQIARGTILGGLIGCLLLALIGTAALTNPTLPWVSTEWRTAQ